MTSVTLYKTGSSQIKEQYWLWLSAHEGAGTEAIIMIPFKLEYVIEAVVSQNPEDQRRVLKRLSGLKLSAAEARTVWPRILEHRSILSDRLGRDVGLRVAVIDYFENLAPLQADRRARVLSPTSLAAFERAMGGQRSLAR